MFRLYRIAFARARKSYRIGSRLAHKKGDFVAKLCRATRISKVESHKQTALLHWYTAGERCKRMFVKMTCLHETCWLIIISTSCWRNSFNFSPNKAENFHLTVICQSDRFRKRLSLSKSLPLHSPFQFQFRTGIRNTYVDQIQVKWNSRPYCQLLVFT